MEKTTVQTTATLPRLVPLSKFNDFVPYPSVGALRQHYFFNTDGFADKVIKRIAKRIYIDIPNFFEWVEETNHTAKV